VAGGGGTPETSTKWRAVGVNDVKHASEWIKLGFTPEEAGIWRNLSFQDAHDFKKNGFEPKEAIAWHNAGFIKAEDAFAWKREGVGIPEAKEWAKSSICRYKWQWFGGPCEEVLEWIKSGFTSNTIWGWKSVGITPPMAKKWSHSGYTAPEARRWIDAGCEPEEVAGWVSSGFTDEEAKVWKKQNLTPVGAKEKRDRYALYIKTNCKNGLEKNYQLLEANPYDVQGCCFVFMGSAVQIFSTNTGLYNMYGTNNIVFVDFGEQMAPKYNFSVHVVGTGAYSYVTAVGTRNIVPKLKSISLP